MKWFEETIHASFQQRLLIDKVLFEQKTALQHFLIFENAEYGRVMALDGVIQTTERDEFIYHEMFAHVPLFSLTSPKKVLIIGGGDGGLLREVLRHPNITKVIQVEIDQTVIDMAKKFFPKHSNGAFTHPKADIVIADGGQFVAETTQQFDVILVDSTDPIGPAMALFETAFYQNCLNCLTPQGVLVTQNGVDFLQLQELITTNERQHDLCQYHGFYQASVPSYIGGNMSFAWASQGTDLCAVDTHILRDRFQRWGEETKYYHPKMQSAAFVLPRYLEQALAKMPVEQ